MTWNEHESLRVALLSSTSPLGKAEKLLLWRSFSTGKSAAVLLRSQLREQCLGNGFLSSFFSPVVGVDFVHVLPMPLPIGSMYVGSGCQCMKGETIAMAQPARACGIH